MEASQSRSFPGELLHRRVPQILGLFIAATWMGVEIGEWLTERFALPESLSSYIFVGMLSLAPSVALLAWGHGARGKDNWTRFQGLFVSLNLLLAAVAVVLLVRPPDVVAATETRAITDESGQTVTYEVAREGFHQRLLAFFWKNESGDPDLDWLSYGAPWLLVEDIVRSPLIAASTPFESSAIIDRFRTTGFDGGIGEPLSLDLQIARERGLRHVITGEIGADQDGPVLTVRVHEVASGDLIGEWSATGSDWLQSIDGMSEQISDVLLASAGTMQAVPDLSIGDHTSESIPAIRTLVEGMRLRAFENDYAGALEAVRTATELDPSFAEAHVQGMFFARLAGDTAGALAHAQRALALDYKLYPERKFVVKANTYGMQLQTEKAIRVLEMWTEVYPNSAEAFALLAQNLLVVARLGDAQRAFERVLELDPSDQRQLLNLAGTYRMQGDPSAAVTLIETYLADHPQDVDAYRSLGATLVQAGALDRARSAYEQATFLDSGNPIAELDLARLDMREGKLRSTQAIVGNLAMGQLTDRQRFHLLAVQRDAYLHTGEISRALQVVDEQAQLGANFLPPFLQVFEIGMYKAGLHALRGDREKALNASAELRAGMQPPLDSLVLFADLEVYGELDEQVAYRETFADLQAFNEQIQLPFMEPFLLEGRARLQRWEGDLDGALITYDEQIEKARRSLIALQDPTVVEGMQLSRAKVLREAGRLDDATDGLQELLSTNPGMPQARLELAQVLADQHRFADARAEIKALKELWAQADPEYLYLQRLLRLETELESSF